MLLSFFELLLKEGGSHNFSNLFLFWIVALRWPMTCYHSSVDLAGSLVCRASTYPVNPSIGMFDLNELLLLRFVALLVWHNNIIVRLSEPGYWLPCSEFHKGSSCHLMSVVQTPRAKSVRPFTHPTKGTQDTPQQPPNSTI